jgi:hypothetical protein
MEHSMDRNVCPTVKVMMRFVNVLMAVPEERVSLHGKTHAPHETHQNNPCTLFIITL